jgi:hypothetical protein
VTELYERFDMNTNHLGHLTKLKQSGIVEDFIAAFESVLSEASRRRFGPMSSWLDPQVGWRLLKEIKNHNRLYPLKNENPPLSLSLNPSLPLLPPPH